ncbi:hypothetical protein C8F01DRAFT_1372198 [Mycena amicta]|nr:hypothetical protein C8F01DRAFT_1372198 [Mycena amicta]
MLSCGHSKGLILLSYLVTNRAEHGDPSCETTEGKLMVDAAKGVQGIIWSALPSMAALSGGEYTQAGSYASNYLNVMRPTGIAPDTDVWAVSLPPSPSSAMYLIDADLDYGLFVRRAIEAPVFPDKQTFATWGEEITIQDQMEQIPQVMGKKVIYNQITPEVFADGLKSAGLPPHILPALTEAFPAFDEFGCSVKDAIFSQEGLGRKPRTWRQFVQVADWSSVLVYIVGVILVLNILDVSTKAHVSYRTLALARLDLQTWTFGIQPVVVTVINCTAQTFFLVERCYFFSPLNGKRTRLILAMVVFFVLLSLGSGIAVSTVFFKAKVQMEKISMTIWLTSSTLANLLLTTELFVPVFLKACNFQQACAGLLQETMLFAAITVSTQLILVCGTYYAAPDTAYYLLAQFALGPVSTISVLSTLLAHCKPTNMMEWSLPVGTRRIEIVGPSASRVYSFDSEFAMSRLSSPAGSRHALEVMVDKNIESQDLEIPGESC